MMQFSEERRSIGVNCWLLVGVILFYSAQFADAQCRPGTETCSCSVGDDCLRCPLELGSTELSCALCLPTGISVSIPKDCTPGCYYCAGCAIDLGTGFVETGLHKEIVTPLSGIVVETCQCFPSLFNRTSDLDLFVPLDQSRESTYLQGGSSCKRVVSCQQSGLRDRYKTHVTETCTPLPTVTPPSTKPTVAPPSTKPTVAETTTKMDTTTSKPTTEKITTTTPTKADVATPSTLEVETVTYETPTTEVAETVTDDGYGETPTMVPDELPTTADDEPETTVDTATVTDDGTAMDTESTVTQTATPEPATTATPQPSSPTPQPSSPTPPSTKPAPSTLPSTTSPPDTKPPTTTPSPTPSPTTTPEPTTTPKITPKPFDLDPTECTQGHLFFAEPGCAGFRQLHRSMPMQSCPGGLLFDTKICSCNWAFLVKCGL